MLVHQSTCNEEALAWRVFPSFQPQHNTVDTVDADGNTKIKFSHKKRLIYTLLYFVACNYSFPSKFCTRREKKSFSLGARCLKFIHHLPGYFVSLGKCFFFYIPWRLIMEKCLFILARFPGFVDPNCFVLFFSGVSSSNHNTSYRSRSITGWGQLKIRIILITKSL